MRDISIMPRSALLKKLIALAVAAVVVVCAAGLPVFAGDTFSPDWKDLGSGQIRTNAVNEWVNVEGMTSTNNPTTGAITKVLVDPGNSSILYVGAVNGGIWKTTDSGKNWTPLTDRQSSLSIGAMNFDSSDATNQTLIAGAGRQSAYGFRSGPLTGIQYSTNGGNTWFEKGRSELYGKDITGVAARGDVMMAAVRNIDNPITAVGLYRSTNGGQSFSNAVTGLPAGNIQSLAADPTNASRFYLSVVNGNGNETGIYRSDDKGATWARVKAVTGLSTNRSNGRILLSAGARGVLVAQVQEGKTRLDLLRTADQGKTWTELGKPATGDFTGLFPSGQTSVHGAVLADPNNPNVVYAAGDTQKRKDVGGKQVFPNSIGANQYSCPIFRGDYDPATGNTTWTHITNDNTKSGSAPHADARTFAVDGNGRLLFGGDGGLNAHPAPTTEKTEDWIPIMDTLRITEMTQSYWNPITHTVSAPAQDVGAFYQFPGQKGTYNWSSTSGGDGGPSPVNAVTFKSSGVSVVYASSQFLGGFSRFEVGKADDAEKAAKTLTSLDPKLNGVSISGNEAYMSFLSLIALNREDPRKMAIGGQQLFIGTDDPTVKDPTNGYSFPVTSILTPANEITSLAYGANGQAGALLAGSGDFWNTAGTGNLYYSSNADTVAMTALNAYKGKYVWKAIFDERDGSRFYVADGADVWRSTDTGVSFSTINGDLPASFVDRRGLAFASGNGVNALFAGGVSNTANGSGVYVSRFKSDPSTDAVAPSWSAFGGNMANAPVYGLSYDATDDVLLVNLLGRGAWVVYDLTSYFPEATSLIFGKADNDSAPAATLLTDGTPVGGGAPFSRALIKTGAGTLTLPNAATAYTGGTQFNGGVIAAYRDDSFGPSGNWSFNGGTLQYLAAFDTGRAVTLDDDGGTFDTNGYSATASGTISGNGSFTKTGPGTITLLGGNTYTGGTTVTAGLLMVNNTTGSGTGGGNVTVEAGGSLGGSGVIGGSVTNSGTVKPGSSIGTLTINGNYTQGPGGKLNTEVASPLSSDLLAVTGTANLNGPLATSWQGGYTPAINTTFGTILTASSGVTGRFSLLLTNITPTVVFTPKYDVANKVYLVVERDYANATIQPLFTTTQRAAAGMLNSVGNTAQGTTGDLNTVLSAIDALPTYTQAANAIDQLAPKGSDAQSGMGISAASFQADNISGRLSDLRQGAQGVSVSGLTLGGRDFITSGGERPILLAGTGSNLSGMMPPGMEDRFGLFVRGNAVFGNQRGTSEQTGYDFTNMGITVGSDYRFTRNFIAGLMLGMNTSRANSDNVGSTVTMDGYTAGTYGTYYEKGLFVDGQFSYGYASYDNTRRIVFPGIDRTATASPKGNQITAYIGTGYDLREKNWTFTPTASLQYIKLDIDSYTESGASAVNLDVSRQNIESLQSNVGGRISYTWQAGNALVIPNIRASYGYEFLRDSKSITAQLAQGSSPFSIETISPNRNFVILGTGVTVIAGNDMSFSINYNAQLGDNKYTAHSINAGLRILF
ncbi:MAG: autotransporter domain-containing protein [candidate division NC10 bacterium]